MFSTSPVHKIISVDDVRESPEPGIQYFIHEGSAFHQAVGHGMSDPKPWALAPAAAAALAKFQAGRS